jgi:hypothetical protein
VVGDDGLQVIDVTNPTSAPTLSQTDTSDWARGVVVVGGHAYVANDASGLEVIDVTDPATPFVVGTIDTPGRAFRVALAGDHAYLACWGSTGISGYLQVVDVSQPADPVAGVLLDLPSRGYDLAITGHHALVAADGAGLQIIDISDPAAPFMAATLDFPGFVQRVTVAGDIAYLTNGRYGLKLVDVTDPTAPVLLGSVSIPGLLDSAQGVAVADGFAYATDRYTGLHVVDVSDPSAPFITASLPLANGAYDVALLGSYAYLAGAAAGLQIVDVSDPTAPRIMGSADTPHSALAVTAVGGRIYLGDGLGGLIVAWRQCEMNVPVFLSSFTAQQESGAVVLIWSVSNRSEPGEFRLQGWRAATAWEVPYQEIGSGRFSARDASPYIAAGGEVVYSLHHRLAGQDWQLLTRETAHLEAPSRARLVLAVHPNPFNPLTTIRFALDRPQSVKVAVFDLAGRQVIDLADKLYSAGTHEIVWDGRDGRGRALPSGSYLVRLRTQDGDTSAKVMLIR